MMKTQAAVSAQARRDNEIQAREDLGAILPAELFDAKLESIKDFNQTTKTLVVAKIHIENLMLRNEQLRSERGSYRIKKDKVVKDHTKTKPYECKGGCERKIRSKFKNKPFLIESKIATADLEEPIRQLRQVAQRIVHKAEDKLMADGKMTNAFRKMLDDSSDLIIGEIEKIENAT